MEQPPQRPLDYASSPERPEPDSPAEVSWGVVTFFLGLAMGVIASCVAYIGGSGFHWELIVWLAVGKLVTAAVVAVIPKLHAVAGGILLSMPVGALIFFGACTANFKI